MAGLGSALAQIYIFKPIDIVVSPVFLLLLIYGIGKAWEGVVFVPHHWLDSPGTFKRWSARTLHFINPGVFGLKEVSGHEIMQHWYLSKISTSSPLLSPPQPLRGQPPLITSLCNE